MFKKLHFALFVLFAFVFISCNFTFNQPEAQQSTSITITCGNGGRSISADEKSKGELEIFVLGDKTNFYAYRKGKVNSNFTFDGLPADTYLISAQFSVNKILRAQTEDFATVTVKPLESQNITLTLKEVELKYDVQDICPDVINDWNMLKSIFNSPVNFKTFIVSNMDIEEVDETITVNKEVNLIAVENIIWDFKEVYGTVFSITSGGKLTFDTFNNSTISITANDSITEKSFFVANNTLELNNVEFNEIGCYEDGGVITAQNCEVILNNCSFNKISTIGNGAVVYSSSGNLTVKGTYSSSKLETGKINGTLYNEDFYAISNNNSIYKFEDAKFNNLVMYINNNKKPTISINENCSGKFNTLVFFADASSYSLTEINSWKDLFSNISDPNGILPRE